jgi:hypothetical protein
MTISPDDPVRIEQEDGKGICLLFSTNLLAVNNFLVRRNTMTALVRTCLAKPYCRSYYSLQISDCIKRYSFRNYCGTKHL